MIKFFQKLLDRDESSVTEVDNSPKSTKYQSMFGDQTVMPFLVSEHTSAFSLNNELTRVFHERENIFGRILNVYCSYNLKEGNSVNYISTANLDENDYAGLEREGMVNLDQFKLPFVFWSMSDKELEFKILSTKISAFAPSIIMSKKHMNEAHKMLDSNKILVSIPREGVILICSHNLDKAHINEFIKVHFGIVLKEDSEMDILCEDIFVVENGEIESMLYVNKLSDILREGLS